MNLLRKLFESPVIFIDNGASEGIENPVRLETTHSIIREFETGDVDRFYELLCVPDIFESFSNISESEPSYGLAQGIVSACMKSARKESRSSYFLPMQLLSDSKMIGFFDLVIDEKDNDAAIARAGYFIDPNHRGKGLISEGLVSLTHYAFSNLGLERVYVTSDESNLSSISVLEKSGFEYEGTLRNAKRLSSGERENKVLYSVIPSDFS